MQVNQPRVAGFCLGALVDYKECDQAPTSCGKLNIFKISKSSKSTKIIFSAPINGDWTDWSDWSQCSKDCGDGGDRVRSRMCAQPVPANQGQYCYGQSFEKAPCSDGKDRLSCDGLNI